MLTYEVGLTAPCKHTAETCRLVLHPSYITNTILMFLIITRQPSNLRPTTRECVHLVTHGHFRSHDKMAVTPFDPL